MEINVILNDLETKYEQMKYNLINIPTKVEDFINKWKTHIYCINFLLQFLLFNITYLILNYKQICPKSVQIKYINSLMIVTNIIRKV